MRRLSERTRSTSFTADIDAKRAAGHRFDSADADRVGAGLLAFQGLDAV